MTAFLSALLNGEPLALGFFVVVLALVAYFWPTALKHAREKAEIAKYGAETATANLEGRFAVKDIHPVAVPPITVHRENTRTDVDAERERRDTGLHGAHSVKLTGHELID